MHLSFHLIRIARSRYLSFPECLGEKRVAGASLHQVLIFIVDFKTTKDVLKRRESIAGKLNGWVLPIQSSTLALGNTQKIWTPGEVVLFCIAGRV
jgi:hypothetical protein